MNRNQQLSKFGLATNSTVVHAVPTSDEMAWRTIWTAPYISAATAQGWNLFDSSAGVQIECDDEAGVFGDDESAADHVKAMASGGDPVAIRAFQALVAAGNTDVNCYGLAERESAASNVNDDDQSGPTTRIIEKASCRSETGIGREETVGTTDQDVVEGAERMARILLQATGFNFSGESVRASSNPRAVSAWNVVRAMLEEYNGTDLSSAVDALEGEGGYGASDCSPIAAFEVGVSAAFQKAKGLSVVFSSMLQDRTRQNAVYHAHSGQQATIVGVGITPAHESGWDEESLPFLKIRFPSGAELPVFGEELFCHDDRFLALCSAVFGGYGAAREVGVGFAGPYHLARDGSIADKQAFLAELKVIEPSFKCVQAPWTPSEFRASDSNPSTET
ncbi:MULTISPECIES: hypothetical protein [Burkholderia cepacia complex]|uniref:Uncharacterized protein n=2 Tax=Burkholderia TaxID=32008 RepID=A0ABY6XNB1_9BURK|nr:MULTISPECIES: hypothetical protein [Burkholderia cepacia complex]VWC58996.1 hypothetical protein BLA17378_02001 [Burkholderia aenigmatica]